MRLLKILLLLPVLFLLVALVVAFYEPDSNYRVGRVVDSLPGSHRSMANFFYERAAQRGHLETMERSGMYYLFGYVEQDKAKGIKYLKDASADNHVGAMSCLVSAYEWGLGVEQDYGEAYRLTKKILKVDPTNVHSQSVRAFFHTVCPPPIRNFKEGFNEYVQIRASGEQEDNPSESIGLYYFYGLTGKPDYDRAFPYLKEAAQLGSTEARSILGTCYFSGLGVGQDYGEAVRWLRLAALQGDLDAQITLGLAYKFGLSQATKDKQNKVWLDIVEKRGFDCLRFLKNKSFVNPNSSVQFVRQASRKNRDAGAIYGIMNRLGIFLPLDIELGNRYLSEASIGGSLDAAVLLSYESLHAPSDLQVMQKHISALRSAWQKGHHFAGVQLVSYLSMGQYCKNDWQESFSILKDAELKYEPAALFLRAQCYMYGLGTKRDLNRGLDDLVDCAKRNYPSAYIDLLDNYNAFDGDNKVKIDVDKIARLSLKLDLPRVKFKLAGLETDSKLKLALLEEAAEAGFIDAQVELASQLRYYPATQNRQKSLKYYKRALKNGRRSVLPFYESLQVELFKEDFKREEGSKKVLRVLKAMKEGAVFTRDSFEAVVSESYIGDSYLDDKKETVEFLLGKHAYSDIKKGDEVALYDIGISRKAAESLGKTVTNEKIEREEASLD